ncbi:hypothetical protein [Microlunatus ginsengisoli]|uniref:Uncharacterized protein n=1 Tax=Microlunatus ginsengisoli TaxID=363863 RepID=A0ABP7A2G8_9ACTN
MSPEIHWANNVAISQQQHRITLGGKMVATLTSPTSSVRAKVGTYKISSTVTYRTFTERKVKTGTRAPWEPAQHDGPYTAEGDCRRTGDINVFGSPTDSYRGPQGWQLPGKVGHVMFPAQCTRQNEAERGTGPAQVGSARLVRAGDQLAGDAVGGLINQRRSSAGGLSDHRRAIDFEHAVGWHQLERSAFGGVSVAALFKVGDGGLDAVRGGGGYVGDGYRVDVFQNFW